MREIFNSKKLSKGNEYDLSVPAERFKYFHEKAGKQIEDLKVYLEHDTFVGFLVAKKLAGKGTYSKMLGEVLGIDYFHHVSVGDIVRDVFALLSDPSIKNEVEDYLHTYYRGFINVDVAIEAFLNKSQDKLIPTEFILTLIKREISSMDKKALFIDGMPRSLDQISYALFFRDLINYRDDKDFFVLIHVPEALLAERVTSRYVCPECNVSKNIKLNPSQFILYDSDLEEPYMLCDNRDCVSYNRARLVRKEGDDLGLEPIRVRLEGDAALMKAIKDTINGIPTLDIYSSVPVEFASDYYEDYEITKAYNYLYSNSGLEIKQEPWVFSDDNGTDSYGLAAAAVVLSLIYKMHETLIG